MPPDLKRLKEVPSTNGLMSRLAYAKLKKAGIELAPLLKKAKLNAAQIDDRKGRVSVQGQIRFLELAADALRDALLGFHMALEFDVREVGLLYYVVASSDTIGDALQRMVRCSQVVNEGVSLEYVVRIDSLAVLFEYVGVPRHSDRQQIEFWITALVRECRELTRQHVVPKSIKFAHRRLDIASELDKFAGVAIEFGARVDEIALPRTVKDVSLVSADHYLNELLVAYCDEARAKRAVRSGGVRLEVENAIALLLPHGEARLEEVARRLGISRRTLTRRLSAEGTSFTKVLNLLRIDLARRHLGDQDLSISQIAWLLGYQEVSAFTHAFKRWTGRTPREARSCEGGVHE